MRDHQLFVPGRHCEELGFTIQPFIVVAPSKADLLAGGLRDAGFTVDVTPNALHSSEIGDANEGDNCSIIQLAADTNITDLKNWLRHWTGSTL